MKDYRLLTLSAMLPRVRVQYCHWMKQQAYVRYSAIGALYEKYAALPPDVVAGLIHRDMQRPGWDEPPKAVIAEVAAERENVAALLVLCCPQDIDGDEYVDDENCRKIYDHLLALHAQADTEAMRKSAESFCRLTQAGPECQTSSAEG